MVGVDDHSVCIAYEIWPPGRQSVDNGDKFLVVDVPVVLCCI